jgi:hypothetical protein
MKIQRSRDYEDRSEESQVEASHQERRQVVSAPQRVPTQVFASRQQRWQSLRIENGDKQAFALWSTKRWRNSRHVCSHQRWPQRSLCVKDDDNIGETAKRSLRAKDGCKEASASSMVSIAAKQPTGAFTPWQRSLCTTSDVDTSETADTSLCLMDCGRKASTKTVSLRRLHMDCKPDLFVGQDARFGKGH